MTQTTLERSWHERYERWAQQHQLEHQIAGWSEDGLTRRVALVLSAMRESNLESGSRILDLGSGPGTYVRTLKHQGFNCLGLDYSWNVTKLAKSKDARGSYLLGEAYHLPFQTGTFDGLLCIGVMQSLGFAREAIREMQRVLRPFGHLFLDGLNSCFWLHALRLEKERIQKRERRMSYYNPFKIAQEIGEMGLRDPRIHWLTIPGHMGGFSQSTSAKAYLTSFCFGYAFLISARKAN